MKDWHKEWSLIPKKPKNFNGDYVASILVFVGQKWQVNFSIEHLTHFNIRGRPSFSSLSRAYKVLFLGDPAYTFFNIKNYIFLKCELAAPCKNVW
jgi:hypothetical protein